jgi:hypothetical protein
MVVDPFLAWSFPRILSYSWASCLLDCTPFVFFYHTISCSFFGPFAPLIVYSYKALVDNTYPKEYTSNNEGSIDIELKDIFYATEKSVWTLA